jgi:hypothetical protein
MMTVYEIGYRSFFSNRKFNITENDNMVGGFERSLMGGTGTITLGNVPYTVTRESLLGGVYFIETGGQRVATANEPNKLHRTFAIESGGKTYALEARRMGGKRFALLEGGPGGRELGKAEPAGFSAGVSSLNVPTTSPAKPKRCSCGSMSTSTSPK